MAVSTQKLLLEIQIKNQQALGRVEKDVNRLTTSQLTLAKAAQAAVASIAALGAVKIAKSIIQTTARFEDLKTSLSAVTGSAQQGAQAFNFITKFATKTQFGVEDLSKAFIKLKASGIQPTDELLTLFTDTAAITTDQIGTLEAVTDLFARTVSGGLGLEEIQRLGDRGVPVLRILKQELGLNRDQISEFGKSAEGAKRITDAFARGIRKEYGGATTKVVNNLSTQFSNFTIALKNSADLFGQALAPEIKTATAELTAFIEANQDTFPAVAKDIAEFSKEIIKLGKDIGSGFKDLYNLADELGIGEIGIIGFLLLGTKGKLAVTALAAITTALKKFNEALEEAGKNAKEAGDDFKSPDDALNGWKTTAIDAYKKAHALVTVFGDFEDPINEAANAVTYYGNTLGQTTALYDDYFTQKDLDINKTEYQKQAYNELREQVLQTFTGRVARGLDDYKVKLDEIIKSYETGKVVTDALVAATKAFETTTVSALSDVILEGKNLEEALGQIGKAILRELVGGIIRLLVVAPILKQLAKIFGVDFVDALTKQVQKQKELNRELGKELVLRALISLFTGGFGGIKKADGGAVGYANGGAIGYGGARAGGGPVNNSNAFLVGERGPELFVPNSAGTIIPSERSGSGVGEVTVNLNINAVDAASFDDLLLSRKNLIVGTIQQAFRQQGRRLA
jgi:hypothetical protein